MLLAGSACLVLIGKCVSVAISVPWELGGKVMRFYQIQRVLGVWRWHPALDYWAAIGRA